MHRTTLFLDPVLERRLKARAFKEKRTLTEMIQSFIRSGLNSSDHVSRSKKFSPPTFAMGRAQVDPADRSRLWDVMDERQGCRDER